MYEQLPMMTMQTHLRRRAHRISAIESKLPVWIRTSRKSGLILKKNLQAFVD